MASNHLDIGHISCCFSGPEGRRSQVLLWVLLTCRQKPGNVILELASVVKRLAVAPLLFSLGWITLTKLMDRLA